MLAARLGTDEAGVHGKAVPAHQALVDAALHRHLEQPAKQVAVAEATVPVLREGGVVGHGPLQPETAEPPVGEVQVHLLAQPPLRADAEAIAYQQHPDDQFGIDRGPARLAVEGPQLLAQTRQVYEPIDRTKQVIRWHVSLKAEAIEQRLLHHRPLAHHQPVSPSQEIAESGPHHIFKSDFFNTIGRNQNDGFADQDVESCRSLSFHRTDVCSVALTLSDLAGKPRLVVTERIR